jgi:hypothetical protein
MALHGDVMDEPQFLAFWQVNKHRQMGSGVFSFRLKSATYKIGDVVLDHPVENKEIQQKKNCKLQKVQYTYTCNDCSHKI